MVRKTALDVVAEGLGELVAKPAITNVVAGFFRVQRLTPERLTATTAKARFTDIHNFISGIESDIIGDSWDPRFTRAAALLTGGGEHRLQLDEAGLADRKAYGQGDIWPAGVEEPHGRVDAGMHDTETNGQ